MEGDGTAAKKSYEYIRTPRDIRVSPRIGFRTPQVEDCKESTHEGEETGTRILEGPALFIRLSSFFPLSFSLCLSSFPPFPASLFLLFSLIRQAVPLPDDRSLLTFS